MIVSGCALYYHENRKTRSKSLWKLEGSTLIRKMQVKAMSNINIQECKEQLKKKLASVQIVKTNLI